MGNGTDQCIVVGDFNMIPGEVDAALRALDQGQWETSDPNGNRDYLFATDSAGH